MMGYTHVAVGAAGAMTVATIMGYDTPGMFITATVAGAIGGVVADIDTRGSAMVTDAVRARHEVVGLVVVGMILLAWLHWNSHSGIIPFDLSSLFGLLAFIFMLLAGMATQHRTFTHSLLFLALTSAGTYFVYPGALVYFVVGGVLHLLLDMLNKPYGGHGVHPLYPLRIGKGIAPGICASFGIGNNVFYFLGLAVFLGESGFMLWKMKEISKMTVPLILIIYLIVTLHIVRRTTERQMSRERHVKDGYFKSDHVDNWDK